MSRSYGDRTDFSEAAATDRHAEFLRLYTRHQHRILAYIYTLVPNRTDAEDLLQDTAVLLWEKFEQFELGTDFVAWACRVAFLKVSNHRKRFARANLLFSDDLLAAVAERTVELAPHLDDRRQALQECLKRLEDRDRRMLTARYEPGGGAEQAAGASGRSLQATYKALYRIRKALFDCVTLRTSEADAR
jgi:RNA polymerase sigma-70 factor (ECF subfamily)